MGAGASSNITEGTAAITHDAKNVDSFDTGNVTEAKPASTWEAVFFKVVLKSNDSKAVIPNEFLIKLAHESLDFISMDSKQPIIQFPYQSIICWGSSTATFQFDAFPGASAAVAENSIKICVKTAEGRLIDSTCMTKIRGLMVDIENKAISKEEFQALRNVILDEDGQLMENWMKSCDQFSSCGRLFLAKQAMELMQLVGPLAPFDKFDLACLLYTRVINKDSFQLVVNTFPDQAERENLIHRLRGLNAPGSDIEKLIVDCNLLK